MENVDIIQTILFIAIPLLLVVGGGLVYYFFVYKKQGDVSIVTQRFIKKGDAVLTARAQLDKQVELIKNMQNDYLRDREELLKEQQEFNKQRQEFLREKEEYEKIKLDIRAEQSNVNSKKYGIDRKEQQLIERKAEVEKILTNTKVEIEKDLNNKHKIKFDRLAEKEEDLNRRETQLRENLKEFQLEKDKVNQDLVRAEALNRENTEKLNKIEIENQNLTMKENALNNNMMVFNNYQAQFTLKVKEEIERINSMREESQNNLKIEMKKLDKEKTKLLMDKQNFDSYVETANNKITSKEKRLIKKYGPKNVSPITKFISMFSGYDSSSNTGEFIDGEIKPVKTKKKTKNLKNS